MVTIDSAPQSNFVTVRQIFSDKPAASASGDRHNFGGIPFLSTAACAWVVEVLMFTMPAITDRMMVEPGMIMRIVYVLPWNMWLVI